MTTRITFKELLSELGIEREEIVKPLSCREYYEFLHKIESDEDKAEAILRTSESYMKNFNAIYSKYGAYMKSLAEEVRKIKEYSIDHIEELIETTKENVEKHHGFFHYAKTAEEARKIIGEIVGNEKLVVKSKSLTTEEIKLVDYLEDLHNEVYETDIGEFLVQALGPRAMHYTVVSLHITRDRVARLLEKLTGKKVNSNDISGMVSLIREFLREKYIAADIGISGVNVIAADPGYIFIIENENNARMVTGLPPVYIAITGIEKIVPTYLDAAKVIDAIVKYAGYDAVSYINIIGGPSKTGDIEKKIVYGAQGPREFHLILLDNGRLKASKDPVLKEALYCLRCGACMFVCPIFRRVAGYWGGETYMGGIGIIWEAITHGLENAYCQGLLCLQDYGCVEHCPMKIDEVKLIKEIIRRVNKQKLQ